MADCCKIIRLLKEVKRKADSSFCEINNKIARLESKYTMLSKENQNLKKEIEESKRKLSDIKQPKPFSDPPIVPLPKDLRRRTRRHKSRPVSRVSAIRCVSKKLSSRRPAIETARRRRRRSRGRRRSLRGKRGKARKY